MDQTLKFLLGSAALLALAASPAGAEPNPVTAPEVVTALEQAYGVHPGQRRNHTKGSAAETAEFAGAMGISGKFMTLSTRIKRSWGYRSTSLLPKP